MNNHYANRFQDTITTEAISFQSGSFFKEVTAVFEKLKNSKYLGEDQAKVLDSIVLKHTGLKTTTILELDTGGFSCGIPKLTADNILHQDHHHSRVMAEGFGVDGLRYYDQVREKLKGSVDLNKSTVGGIFSRINVNVYMDAFLIFDQVDGDSYSQNVRLSAEEMAAMYIHEIGHIFCYYEFIVDTVTTNQILNNVCNVLLAKESEKERIIYLEHVEKDLDFTINKGTVIKSENKAYVYSVLIKDMFDRKRSSTDSRIYDINSWEAVADQFATHHGAGKALVTGAYKLETMHDKNALQVTPTNKICQAIALASLSFIMITIHPLFAVIPATMLLVDKERDKSIQASPIARFTRVKNELVLLLKDKKLSQSKKIDTLADINAIEILLSRMEETRSVMEVFWDFANRRRADDREDMLFQQKLESMSNNSLFIHAAKLSTLS